MVRRQRAEFGGERGTAGVRQLIGVELHRESVGSRGEDASCLRFTEADRLAKGIDRIRDSLPCGGGNGFAAHEIDVIVGAPIELDGHRVGREQRRAKIEPDLRRETPRRAQLPALGFGREPIA